MKIKTKKQLNLPQLIEWAIENEIKDKMFLTESAYCVGFDKHGFIYFNSTNCMPLDQLFTVEVEEEVNSETVLEKAYEVSFRGASYVTNTYHNTTLNNLIDCNTSLIYTVIDEQLIVLWEKYTGGFR